MATCIYKICRHFENVSSRLYLLPTFAFFRFIDHGYIGFRFEPALQTNGNAVALKCILCIVTSELYLPVFAVHIVMKKY